MSIQNEIDRIQSNVSAAYSAVEDKGGTLPDVQNSASLPAAIRSIPSGGIMLESIAITTPPEKTAYKAGDSFDPAGMVVTATYSNGATLITNACAVVPGGPMPDGMTAVTVRYTEGGVSAEAVQPVAVAPRLTGLRIDTPPSKTVYRYGESFNPAGMVVTAMYSDGSTKPVSGYGTMPETFSAMGSQAVYVSYEEGDITAEAVIYVTVGRVAIATLPSQKTALTYTGAVLSPEWDGYDPAKLTISGVTQATGAGSYEAVFTPTSFYEWADGSIVGKQAAWSIAKAEGSMSLSTTAVSLNAAAPEAVIQVTRAGMGAVSAVSSNPGIAAVSVSGTQVTVSSVGQANGTAVVTVSVAADANHTAPESVACAVTASFVGIYGAVWDGSSTTKLIRTDDAALFSDPVPAVGSVAGASPFDGRMPWSGMVRVTQDGNELVAIPKYWVKVSHNPFKVQIADAPVEGYQVSPAHRDRGDGKGERDVVYIGRYECDGSYMSRSGQAPKVSTPIATFRSGIHNLGAEYWQADYALQLTWWFLYIVEFAEWNGLTTIGNGVVYAPAINTGATDSMIYHTGRAAGTDGHTAIQYRNIENPWGNVREWRDGIIFSSENISTYNNPANFSDSYAGTGSTTRSNKRPATNGHIKAWGCDANDASFIYPSEIGGSGTTFVANFCLYNAGVRALFVGGDYSFNSGVGPFYLYGGSAPTSTSNNIGSRLQKIPNAA